jgi:hypothetical protein
MKNPAMVKYRSNISQRSYSIALHTFAMSLIFIVAISTPACKADKHVQSDRDAIINESSNIAAQAFAYRMRTLEMQGGNRSYLGFVLPENMRRTDFAVYEVQVLSADTLRIFARSVRDSSNTITSYRDKDSRSFGWIYEGAFMK